MKKSASSGFLVCELFLRKEIQLDHSVVREDIFRQLLLAVFFLTLIRLILFIGKKSFCQLFGVCAKDELMLMVEVNVNRSHDVTTCTNHRHGYTETIIDRNMGVVHHHLWQGVYVSTVIDPVFPQKVKKMNQGIKLSLSIFNQNADPQLLFQFILV